MAKLLVEDKAIVVPGEELAEGMEFLPAFGTYRDKTKIVSERLGLVQVDNRLIKVIPLAGRYNPKKGDVILGHVFDITTAGWRVDTNSAYSGMIPIKEGSSDFIERGTDLSEYYNIGDLVVCRIINVTSQKLIDFSMRGPGLRRLEGGRIIKVAPSKIPRVIGKGGSMVSMIKQATGCRIVVGQNGIIWVSGEPEMEIKAVDTIMKIQAEAHISGLTDSIKEYLDIDAQPIDAQPIGAQPQGARSEQYTENRNTENYNNEDENNGL